MSDELARLPPGIHRDELDPRRLADLAASEPAAFRRLCGELSRWPIVTESDIRAVTDHLRSGPTSVIDPDRGVSGELARRYQEKVGLRREHAVTFNSATNALNAAYRAVGVGPGAKVAAIGYTFHATVSPVLDLGGHPILMDVDPVTGNLTYEEVLSTLDAHPDVRALGLNHNWGVPTADIRRIADLARERGVPLIEDCSHAHGASVDGVPVGAFGTISVFSLQSKKLVPAGEGGLLYTDDRALKSAVLLVGHYSVGQESHVVAIDDSLMQTGLGGLQNRMHPLAAALALSQLERLDDVIRNREANEELLRELLAGSAAIEFPGVPAGTRVSRYACRARFRPEPDGPAIEDYVERLRRAGAPVQLDRGGPLSRKTIYREDVESPVSRLDPARPRYDDGDLPHAVEFCRRSLVFPVFSLDPDLVSGVIRVIADRIRHAERNPT